MVASCKDRYFKFQNMTLENHKVCQVVDLLHFDAIYEIFWNFQTLSTFYATTFFWTTFW